MNLASAKDDKGGVISEKVHRKGRFSVVTEPEALEIGDRDNIPLRGKNVRYDNLVLPYFTAFFLPLSLIIF